MSIPYVLPEFYRVKADCHGIYETSRFYRDEKVLSYNEFIVKLKNTKKAEFKGRHLCCVIPQKKHIDLIRMGYDIEFL